MYKLMSKEILPQHIQDSILSTEQVGEEAFKSFVSARLTGDANLWDKMTKVKLLNWTSAGKEIKVKTGSDEHTLKASSSLFARLLIVARSSREDINLEEVIELHEFDSTNRVLMKPDGSLHPTTDKSKVIHLLESLVQNEECTHVDLENPKEAVCLIVDGMGAVQELMAVKNFKNCQAFGEAFVKLVDSKGRGYNQVRIIFDNYTITSSLKESTREKRRSNSKGCRSYSVEHQTRITDKKMFLSSNKTKDSLTLYLAQQLIDNSKITNLMTATRRSVMTKYECHDLPGVSTQEEADTLMIFHAVQVARTGYGVHIYSQDTDVLLLALRRVPLLGVNPVLLMGTGANRRNVYVKAIFNKLGAIKSTALINWHALTGCDTTGHIKGKGRQAASLPS